MRVRLMVLFAARRQFHQKLLHELLQRAEAVCEQRILFELHQH